MTAETRIHCRSGQPDVGAETLSVTIADRAYGLKLRIGELTAKLVGNLDPLIVDLIEVAGYVYAADSLVGRGGHSARRMGEQWRRKFHFDVPVRCPEAWSRGEVTGALERLLSFVSDDEYRFTFRAAENPAPFDDYFDFGSEAGLTPVSVMMFSGGLDSFAGALEEVIGNRRPVVLVTHRSGTKLAPVQRHQVKYLRAQTDAPSVLHVPVTAQVADGKTRESTHRSRSFLFAALGIATARCFGLDQLKFYENGVVSMNLPLGNHVVGARATRSTHPETLAGFGKFFSLLFGREARVENPFFWKTKAEVIEIVRQYAAQDQIEHTRSCAHVRDITKQHSHCGSCSQCVDRRLSMLVCGMAELDPPEKYKFDLLGEAFRSTHEKELALAYIRAARAYRNMNAKSFIQKYPEALRALDALGQDRKAGLVRLAELHNRHGRGISKVTDDLLTERLTGIDENSVSEDTLLTLIGQERFASRQPFLTEGTHGQNSPIVPPVALSLKLVVTPNGTRVEIEGLEVFQGVDAEVLTTLALNFLEARGRGLAPEDHPFMKASRLAEEWRLATEEAVRKRFSTLRATIAKRAKSQGRPAPDRNAVVENIPWVGYRLNPTNIDVVRIHD